MTFQPVVPLPPMPRIWLEGHGLIENHQRRRDLANKCVWLINDDRRAEAKRKYP